MYSHAMNSRRSRHQEGVLPVPPEGPYEVEGEPPRDWSSSMDMLRVIDFVADVEAEAKRYLPLDVGMRELRIVLQLVRNHFTGRLTTLSSLARGSSLSYGTALRAIDALTRAGFIDRRPHTGTGKSFSLHPSTHLLQRWQVFARSARRLGEGAFGVRDGRRLRSGSPAPSRADARAVIPPPAILARKLKLARGLRVLVHADPTFMVMNALKQQFEMILGVPIRSKALSIDRLREEIVANSSERVSEYDIVACDLPWFGDMVLRGRLMALDPLIATSGIDLSDFIPDAVASARRGGQQFGVPVLTTAEMLVYRTDMLERAGLSPPRTIAQTLEAAARLHAPAENRAGIAWNAGRGTALGHTFMVIMAAHGQPIVNLARNGAGFLAEDASGEHLRPMFDSEAARATAEFLRALLAVSPPGILQMTWYDRARAYASGAAAMAYSHTLLANLFELDAASPAYRRTGYLPHPTALQGRPVSPLGGYALAIPANIASERINAAWTALCTLTSASAAKLFVANGSLASPRFSVSRDPEVAAMSPTISVVDHMARDGVLRMWPRPPVPGISALIAIAGEELHDALSGGKTLTAALADAQNRADAEMRHRGAY